MDSRIVIKVKYGDTLRRITAYADEKGLRDLTMAGLKNKMHTLFHFPPNADLTMTYTDEDKDEVTLVDDNDLYDATTQKLNPLRITVVTKRLMRPRTDHMSANSWDSTESIPVVHSPFPMSMKGAMGDAFIVAQRESLLKMQEEFNNIKAMYDSSKSTYTTTHSSSLCPIRAIKTPPVLSPNGTGLPASYGNRCENTSSGIGAAKGDCIKSGIPCHVGVQCDGCLVCPIMGPRFNSKVKKEIDFCSVCFAAMGNETEYKQIDAPINVHCPGPAESEAENFTDVRRSYHLMNMESKQQCIFELLSRRIKQVVIMDLLSEETE